MKGQRLALVCGLLFAITLFGMFIAVERTSITATAPELAPILAGAKMTPAPIYRCWVSDGSYYTTETDLSGLRVGDPFPDPFGGPSPITKSIDVFPQSHYELSVDKNKGIAIARKLLGARGDWKIDDASEWITATKHDAAGHTVIELSINEYERKVRVDIMDRTRHVPKWRMWVFHHLHI